MDDIARKSEEFAARLAEIEKKLSDSSTLDDRAVYNELMREHARLKELLHKCDILKRLEDDIREHEKMLTDESEKEDFKALVKEEMRRLEEKREKTEKEIIHLLVPPDKNDDRNTIVEIRAGTGGEEASLFAANLFRMYSRYAERMRWKLSTLSGHPTELGGLREIIFSVEGKEAYKRFQYESGIHRVQRVPTTESSGRIHTSAVTVAVMPEAEPVEVRIDPKEIRVDIFRASGPGGQSVNTMDSAVRITHLPTNIMVQCQDEKSQHRNKEKAMRHLRAKLLKIKEQEEREKISSDRRSQIGSGDRSEKIRTYNFPQNRVTDHRINLSLHKLDQVLDGDLDEIVEGLIDDDFEKKLREQIETA